MKLVVIDTFYYLLHIRHCAGRFLFYYLMQFLPYLYGLSIILPHFSDVEGYLPLLLCCSESVPLCRCIPLH